MLSVISINAVAGIDHRWQACSNERVSEIATCRKENPVVNNGEGDVNKTIAERNSCEDKAWAQYDTCTLNVIKAIARSMKGR